MPSILPSLTDTKLKNRYRGEVVRIDHTGIEVVAIVYGKTLEVMRKRKYLLIDILQEEENSV